MSHSHNRYAKYNDIVGIEAICRGVEGEAYEPKTSNVQRNGILQSGVSRHTLPMENQQLSLAAPTNTQYFVNPTTGPNSTINESANNMNYTPDVLYSSFAPASAYSNEAMDSLIPPIQPLPIPVPVPIQQVLTQDVMPQKYKHRTDFSKRQRRKHREMERIYDCDFDGCDKAYESISHLNTHREKKNHGEKKSIYDFE
eukprot:NODE_444_length_8544_cov_0.465127.p4 type:complete len:198 gc:universal NODE_444_length_8544_cov_0.465127:5835-6428(+)